MENAGRMKLNDSAQFDALFETHHRSVYRYVFYLTENRDEADELFQEVWLKVVQNISKTRDLKNSEAWLLTLASNLFKDKLRKKRIRSILSLRSFTDQKEEQDIARSSESHKATEDFELRDVLQNAISSLPAKQARVFILKEIEGFKHHEIADILNIPTGTVKSLLHRAVRSLRQDLLPYRESES